MLWKRKQLQSNLGILLKVNLFYVSSFNNSLGKMDTDGHLIPTCTGCECTVTEVRDEYDNLLALI